MANGSDQVMHIRLDPADHAWLKGLAERLDCSMQQLIVWQIAATKQDMSLLDYIAYVLREEMAPQEV